MPSSEESDRERKRERERERDACLRERSNCTVRGGRETANTEKTTDEENKKRRLSRASHTKPEVLASETKSKRDENQPESRPSSHEKV